MAYINPEVISNLRPLFYFTAVEELNETLDRVQFDWISLYEKRQNRGFLQKTMPLEFTACSFSKIVTNILQGLRIKSKFSRIVRAQALQDPDRAVRDKYEVFHRWLRRECNSEEMAQNSLKLWSAWKNSSDLSQRQLDWTLQSDLSAQSGWCPPVWAPTLPVLCE